MLRLALLLTCLSTPVQAKDLRLNFVCPSAITTKMFIMGEGGMGCEFLASTDPTERRGILIEIVDVIEVNGREIHIGKLELNGRIVYSAGALEQELIG